VIKQILYFQHVSSLGGSGLCLLKLIQGLDKTQHKPWVVLREQGPLVALLEEAGAIIFFDRHQYMFGYCSGFHPEWWELGFYRSILRFPISAWTGFRWAKKLVPDVVHVNSMALIASGVGAKLAGCKTIIHIREETMRGWFGFRRRVVAFMLDHFFDRMIAICKANRSACGADPARCELVYDWVAWDKEVAFDPSELRKKLEIPDCAHVILFLGGESPIKGTDIFYEALGQLNGRDDVVVICAGPGLVPKKRRQRIYRLKLDFLETQIHVPFLRVGIVQNVGEYLNLSDFLVVPSAVPHFSNPLIEAGWLGKPTIMSNDVIGREMITDGVDGRLFDPENPHDLAEKMDVLLNDSLLCRQMGERAEQKVHANCSGENVRKIESIYKEVENGI